MMETDALVSPSGAPVDDATLEALRRLVEAERFRAGAKTETAIHTAADSYVPKLSVALRYAFLCGRRALRHGNADDAALAVRRALEETLPGMLRRVVVAGGAVGVKRLVRMRAAAFNEDQPRDEHGRWSPGGGTIFHGTPGRSLTSIFKHGIRPSTVYGPDIKAWVTSSFLEAAGYAERTGKNPVILEVRVPRAYITKFKKEWTSGGRATGVVRETTRTFRGTIPAEWIKNARTPDGKVLRTAELNEADEKVFYLILDLEEEAMRAASHKLATTQVNLPADLAARFAAFPIPDEDLAPEHGRETDSHITVKYGLVDASPDDVRDALVSLGPFTVTLGKVATFEGVEDGTADAVIVEVHSLALRQMNRRIAGEVETLDSHHTYKPHVTLAYVKPGLGKKYAGDTTFEGIVVRFNRVVFSSKDDEIFEIPLGDKRLRAAGGLGMRAAEFNLDQPRDEQGQWTSGGHGVQVDISNAIQTPRASQVQAVHDAIASQPTWVQEELARRSSVTLSRISPSQETGGHVFFSDRTKDADVKGHLSHEIGHVMDYHVTHPREQRVFISAFKEDAKSARVLTDKELGFDGHARMHYFTSSKSEAFAELYSNTQGVHTASFSGGKTLKDYMPKTYAIVDEWVKSEGKSMKALELKRKTIPGEYQMWFRAAATVKMRFDITNPAVLAWVERHAAELVTNISETTRERVRLAIEELQAEGDVDLAHDRILHAVGDEDRATLIARHETMMAAGEGQRQAWSQAVDAGLLTGDERRTWIVTDDERLCPICAELDGAFADLGGVYPGGYDGPPAHIQCRCTEGIA